MHKAKILNTSWVTDVSRMKIKTNNCHVWQQCECSLCEIVISQFSIFSSKDNTEWLTASTFNHTAVNSTSHQNNELIIRVSTTTKTLMLSPILMVTVNNPSHPLWRYPTAGGWREEHSMIWYSPSSNSTQCCMIEFLINQQSTLCFVMQQIIILHSTFDLFSICYTCSIYTI